MTEDAFDILEGQKALIPLTALLRKETIPHALLFTGIEGVGKKAAAMAMAMACNCDRSAVEPIDPTAGGNGLPSIKGCECRSCRKIRSGNHPDIHWVEASGAYIKIDQVRTLRRSLALKPYEAKIRFAVLSGAQKMNPEAANALLKILEEPPDRTILILTAVQKGDLLPTIVSRCRPIRFSPLPRKQVERLLVDKHGLTPDEAASMADLLGGRLAGIENQEGGMNVREWARWRKGILGICAALLDPERPQPMGMLLAFAEKLAKNRDILSDSLDIIKLWLRDLMIHDYAPEKTINRDSRPVLQNLSRKMTVGSLLSKIEAIGSAQQALVSNANPRLTMEVLVLRLARNIT